jgi:hypothetical protein
MFPVTGLLPLQIDIAAGNSIDDSYFAQKVVANLVKIKLYQLS